MPAYQASLASDASDSAEPVLMTNGETLKSLPSHTDFLGHYDYSFDWPQGTIRARLDARAWGKNRNLFLYFTTLHTGAKHVISVFWDKGYRVRENDALSFRRDVQEGEVFELDIGTTKHGKLKLLAARKV